MVPRNHEARQRLNCPRFQWVMGDAFLPFLGRPLSASYTTGCSPLEFVIPSRRFRGEESVFGFDLARQRELRLSFTVTYHGCPGFPPPSLLPSTLCLQSHILHSQGQGLELVDVQRDVFPEVGAVVPDHRRTAEDSFFRGNARELKNFRRVIPLHLKRHFQSPNGCVEI